MDEMDVNVMNDASAEPTAEPNAEPNADQSSGPAASGQPSNEEVALMLERIASLLEVRDENPYRVRAYRDGAERVRALDTPVAETAVKGGEEALREIPGIGGSLAQTIVTFVETGHSEILETLQVDAPPEALITQVPGIGKELAHRIVTKLGISTLEELEQAANDGRLKRVQGFGPKRIKATRESLAVILGRAGAGDPERRLQPTPPADAADPEWRLQPTRHDTEEMPLPASGES